MSARDDLQLELRAVLRARAHAKQRIEYIGEQRAELMQDRKVRRYVELHAEEQTARDHLDTVQARILALVDLLEEAP